jgi:hypothetical protein
MRVMKSLPKPESIHWFHRTTPDRLTSIMAQGLHINCMVNLTLSGEWSFEVYGLRPVFLSQSSDTRYDTHAPVLFEVNVAGLSLVADLPALVDVGAYYDLDDYAMWFETGPELSFDDLLNPLSYVCHRAIRNTKSAVCLASIPSERLQLVGSS